MKEMWVFRGLVHSEYDLESSLERESKAVYRRWEVLEELTLPEFMARARSHLRASLIPTDLLTWLAEMQHSGAPTRLVDFTYSPFVALYFAIRSGYHDIDLASLTPIEQEQLISLLVKAGERPPRTHIRLWAIDAKAVNDRFKKVVLAAKEKPEQEPSNTAGEFFVSWAGFRRQRGIITDEQKRLSMLIEELLSDDFQDALKETGCICTTPPAAFNSRLASQQGLFMINFVDDLNFWKSLTMMMEGCRGWAKTVTIPIKSIPIIERELFKMNIHEQSLFPDMQGLAGFIRQKIRLHWGSP